MQTDTLLHTHNKIRQYNRLTISITEVEQSVKVTRDQLAIIAVFFMVFVFLT